MVSVMNFIDFTPNICKYQYCLEITSSSHLSDWLWFLCQKVGQAPAAIVGWTEGKASKEHPQSVTEAEIRTLEEPSSASADPSALHSFVSDHHHGHL